jgi:outer membrane receptor protein involved in Fe transport
MTGLGARRPLCFGVILWGLAATSLAGAIHGIVEDSSGAPLQGAVVRVGVGASGKRIETDARGRFAVVVPPGTALAVSVDKPGFRRAERVLTDAEPEVHIVLEPASAFEKVVVSATRTSSRLGDTAASIRVLSSRDLEASASPAIDDALRQVPGFALFRRSGSRSANPTSQGVSLRGVGGSGASRAVVLEDGVPLNDPFGGWVYWGRVPRAALDRIEVLRGGASDLWGDGALSGAVQLVRRETVLPASLTIEGSGGSQDTADASLYSAIRLHPIRVTLSGEGLSTGGYVPVEESARGPVDVEAGSRRSSADVTVERLGASGRIFARASIFDEARENGTPLQVNDTRIVQATAGADRQLRAGSLSVRAWGSDQDYHQTFSAVAPDRASERLTRLQEVPADALGISLQWSAGFGAHTLLAGVDSRRVRGESREEILAGDGSSLVASGGEERSGSLFLQDVFAAGPRVTVSGGVRVDTWENRNGRRSTRASRDAAPAAARLADRDATAWSPRLSLLYRIAPEVTLSASAYRSFRAPTLNELYRSFRVGSVDTLANERLSAERLSGADAGAAFSSHRLFARAVLFWMEVEDPIVNVTLSATSSLLTRQRRNLGRVRSRGVEVDGETGLGRNWKVSLGYLFSDSTVIEAPGFRELEGRRTPQVARQQGSVGIRYDVPAMLLAALQARWVGRQFEDDQNQLPLDSYWTADAVLSRAVASGLDVFVAGENLFDERYDIGRTPVVTVGPGRTLRMGVRWNLPSRWPLAP